MSGDYRNFSSFTRGYGDGRFKLDYCNRHYVRRHPMPDGPPHPAGGASPSWVPSGRFSHTSASWIPCTTAPASTRLPWHRAASRRIHFRTSGALQRSPASAAGLLPAPRGPTGHSDFGIPPLCSPRPPSTSTCSTHGSIDGNSIGRGAAAGFQKGEHGICAGFTPTSACCSRRCRPWERQKCQFSTC